MTLPAPGPGAAPPPLPDLLPDDTPQRPLIIRATFAAAGILLVLVGIVGWLVPIVPGWPALVPGVLLLAAASRRVRNLVNALERKLPTAWRMRLRRRPLPPGSVGPPGPGRPA